MINDIKKDAQARMQKSIEGLRFELTKLRTGRASTALVDNIKVNYYGSDMPLSQVATVAIADARSLTITPWEKPMVAAVEKAIFASDLGLTPNTAGQVIRINLPPLTEERRKELAKHVAGEEKIPRSRSATSAATPCIRSRNCSRTSRSARTKNVAPKPTSRH